jgi:hypothetical protein
MGSFNQTSSPIRVLQPQMPPRGPFDSPSSMRPSFNSPFTSSSSESFLQSSSSSWSTAAAARTPISPAASLAGRKRSRDEAAPNLDIDNALESSAMAMDSALERGGEDEWVYGEGMTLIKPGGSNYIAAGSQTGTWAEEKAEDDEDAKDAAAAASLPSPDRPMLRSAKSQRLDLTSTPSIAEEGIGSNSSVATPGAGSPGKGGQEPTVDDFTRHLGIGWSLISADPDIQAAARGWARYIDNHFPITDAKIRLQSRGLASYLVEATEGYFLFGEDLKQGRLVSTSLEKTWENLRGPVPAFDGEGVMEAGETPKADGGAHALAETIEMDGVDSQAVNGAGAEVAGQTLEFEMDMS